MDRNLLDWQKTSGIMQRSFQKDLKTFACKDTKSVDIVLCTNCTTTFSTTLFCVSVTRQDNSSEIQPRL